MLIHKSPLRPLLVALSGGLLAGCATSPDASVTPPVGKQVLVGGALTMRGMTSDGWAVYSDNATLTLHAVPISGGAPHDIVSLGDSFAVSFWGKVVFAWSNKNAASVGPLTVWTSAGGPHAVSSASLAPWVAATVDGTKILYLDNVDAQGQMGDLVAAAGDGSSPSKILTGLTGLSNDGCQALLGFAGSYALAAHCDGGATSATISSFTTASWRQTDLVTGAADSFVTDPGGTIVLTATSAGTVVVPIAGGAPTIIDPAGSTGVLVANGQSAIYGAAKDELRRSPVSSPSPTTLVGSGVGGLYGVSPDENFVLYYKQMDSVDLLSDMYLASATKPGTPMTLSATPTAGVFGDAFTTDGSHALYFAAVDQATETGTLDALAFGSDAPTALTNSGYEAWATTGAKIVFSDHYTWTGSRGHTDVRTVDTSGSAEATLIVNQADSEVFLSPERDQVVYTWSLEDSPRAGLYVAPIP
jgi:hypothetical protein